MKLELLISTLNKKPKELIKKMNIQSDAIIVCQTNYIGYEEVIDKGNKIRIFYFDERGLALSRNNALMRATGDILLIADDDEVLKNNYESEILNEFERNSNASMIVFNIDGNNIDRKIYMNKKNKRLHRYNCLRYGSVRMAFKRNVILKNNVYFPIIFGAGAKYKSGEDSVFIYRCIKSKIKVYSSTKFIADVDFSTSSWFNGYDENFFFDKGALLYALHKSFSLLFIFIFVFRHPYMTKNIGINNALLQMIKGNKEIKHLS